LLLKTLPLLLIVACRGAVRTPPQYEPAESLLTIVAEFQRYRDADLYRFPYPRDVSGQNVFKSTLVRLGNYETLYPNKNADVIAYTRAQAYGRLGEYEQATSFCKLAAKLGVELAGRANQDLKALEDFRKTTAFARKAETLADLEKLLQERVQGCKQLVAPHSAQPWLSLAQCEWEQAEVDLAEFLWANRQVIANGPKRALDLLEQIRTRHRQSKNFYRHTLRLGNWAHELAAEYAVVFPPERAQFLWDDFQRWVARAKSLYLEVGQSFGAQERSEAAAQLAALEALEFRVRDLNQ